jgi:transcriptional adapter 3
MAQLFTPYPSVSSLRSQLLTNPPKDVPAIEDLMSLEAELKNLKTKSVARGKKAENDLKTLEGLHRKNKDREKEKEKGKLKERTVKIKREATGGCPISGTEDAADLAISDHITLQCPVIQCLTDTPDPHVPTAPSSAPSSVPPGGHGVKALLGSKTVPTKTFPSKTLPGMKNFSPAASGSGSTSKDKLRKEKDRSTPLEKEKKKCALIQNCRV